MLQIQLYQTKHKTLSMYSNIDLNNIPAWLTSLESEFCLAPNKKKQLKAAVDQQLTQLIKFLPGTVTTCDTAQISLNHVTLSGKDST